MMISSLLSEGLHVESRDLTEASDEALAELLKTDKGKKKAANAIWSVTHNDFKHKNDGTRTVMRGASAGGSRLVAIDSASAEELLALLKGSSKAMAKLKLGESVDVSELDLEDEYTKMVVSLIESAGDEIFLVEMNDAKMDSFFVVFRSILIQYDKALNEKERTNNNARLGLWMRALNKAMDHVKGMEDNDETVKKLRVAITKEFISDYPPGSKFIRVIDNYLNKGQFPKIPISKEVKAAIAAEKAAKKALKNSPKTTPKPEMNMAAESVSGSLSSQLQEAFTGNVPASTAKKWAASIVTELKRQITTKEKPKSIVVAKSDVSYPRSWDYSMSATVKVTLPSDEEIDVKYYVNVADAECSGSVDLPSKWGGTISNARSSKLDEVTKRLTSEVAHQFTMALRKGEE